MSHDAHIARFGVRDVCTRTHVHMHVATRVSAARVRVRVCVSAVNEINSTCTAHSIASQNSLRIVLTAHATSSVAKKHTHTCELCKKM